MVALGLQGDIGPIPAAGVGILAAAVGVLNGVFVVRFGINSFIVTLAAMIAVRGVAMTLSNAAPIRGADPSFGPSVDRAIFGPLWEHLGTFLTPRILIFLGLLLVAHLFLLFVRQGRNIYAVGGNPEARACPASRPRRMSLGPSCSAACVVAWPGPSWACP